MFSHRIYSPVRVDGPCAMAHRDELLPCPRELKGNYQLVAGEILGNSDYHEVPGDLWVIAMGHWALSRYLTRSG